MLSRTEISRTIAPYLNDIATFQTGIISLQAQGVRSVLDGAPLARTQEATARAIASTTRKAAGDMSARLTIAISAAMTIDQARQTKHFANALARPVVVPAFMKRVRQQQVRQHVNRMRLMVNSIGAQSIITARQALAQAYNQVRAGIAQDRVAKTMARYLQAQGATFIMRGGRQVRDVYSWVDSRLSLMIAQESMKEQMDLFHSLNIPAEQREYHTSSHEGARPDHEVWQGMTFSDYDTFVATTGLGDIDGLGGINCRHEWFGGIKGITENPYNPVNTAQNERMYQNLQKQRAIERGLRTSKKQLAVHQKLGLPTNKIRGQITSLNSDMRSHLEATGLPRQRLRERV